MALTRQHYNKFEVLYIFGGLVCIATLKSWIMAASRVADYQRLGVVLAYWQPLSWEVSSQLMIILLIPGIVLTDRYFPLGDRQLLRNSVLHGLFTVPFALIHVAGMVILRKFFYLTIGEQYHFGNFTQEFFYEYRKDAYTYCELLLFIYLYRFVVSRLQGEAKTITTGESNDQQPKPDRLLVKKIGREFIVKITDIDWIEASGNYMNITVNNRVYPLRETMNNLEKKLDPGQFIRIHRSTIVNLDRIQEIKPLETGDFNVVLNSGKVLKLSRRYREKVKDRLF